MRHWLTNTMLLSALLGFAAQSQAETVRFVACPIYRDTDAGRKSGCWLSDDPATGARYDISLSPAKPDWNYAVLIEGEVGATQSPACGGIVLEAVRASIVDEVRCPRHMLPAEGFPGRKFVLPKRNLTPLSVERPALTGPFADTSFYLFFDYRRAFLTYQYTDYLFDQAVHFIRSSKPKRLFITAYADTREQVISGVSIHEDMSVAQARADLVRESLIRMGIEADIITVDVKGLAEPKDVEASDGLAEASRRRVEIRVTF